MLLFPTSDFPDLSYFTDMGHGTALPVACAVFVGFLLFSGGRQRWRRRHHFDRHKHHILKSEQILGRLGKGVKWQSELAYLRAVHPSSFEELLLTALAKAGYRIQRNKRYTGDGGLDGKMWMPDGRLVLIQAKRYGGKVSLQHIKDFSALCVKNNCSGLFIHTGKTPKIAWSRTISSSLMIISGPRLIDFLADPVMVLSSTRKGESWC
jgi:restriction system protein